METCHNQKKRINCISIFQYARLELYYYCSFFFGFNDAICYSRTHFALVGARDWLWIGMNPVPHAYETAHNSENW